MGRLYKFCICLYFCVHVSSAGPRRIIVDQDTLGPTTNTNSIAALLCASDVHVEGITVASGDGWLEPEVLHVLRLLEIMNRTDVPVYAGSAGPLVPTTKEETTFKSSLYGQSSWLGAWMENPPDPYFVNHSHFPEGLPVKAQRANMSAAEFIARTVRENPGEISILALAPMTNIATAMLLEPKLPELAKELVFMGGAIACGKTTQGALCDAGNQPWREFNTWFDPHAAKKVLRTVPYVTKNWSNIAAFPADVAAQAMWTASLQDAVRAIQDESVAARYMVQYSLGTVQADYPMFDEFTVAFWVSCTFRGRDGSVGRGCTLVNKSTVDIDVSVEDGSRGMLLQWEPGTGPKFGEQPSSVYLGQIDIPLFEQIFVDTLRQCKADHSRHLLVI